MSTFVHCMNIVLTSRPSNWRSLHASGNMRPPEERLVPWTSTKNASYLDLCFASGRWFLFLFCSSLKFLLNAPFRTYDFARRSITAMDTVLRCVICMHKVIHGELRGSSTCPLCHSLLWCDGHWFGEHVPFDKSLSLAHIYRSERICCMCHVGVVTGILMIRWGYNPFSINNTQLKI